MRITSVNVSAPRAVVLDGVEQVTGIDKVPHDGPVWVGADGLEGDGVGNTADHGGPDQAVYCYGSADYDWWAADDAPGSGAAPVPGLFGENLTVEGLASADLAIGERLRVGAEVLLEVTGPRIPCATLARRVGDGGFAKRFAAARRPGAYCRVLEEGPVEAGDGVTRLPAEGPSVPLLAAQDLYYDVHTPPAQVRAVLDAPVTARLRALAEGRLERAG